MAIHLKQRRGAADLFAYVIMNNKYLILDAGNVLFNVNFEPFAECLRTYFKISDPYEWSEKNMPWLDLGLKTYSEIFNTEFGGGFVHTDDGRFFSEDFIKKLNQLWFEAVTPNYEILNIVKEIYLNKTNIIIASNIGIEHEVILNNTFEQMKFKNYVSDISSSEFYFTSYTETKFIKHYSKDVGARKPTKLYFQSLLIDYPWAKGNLYLDDRDVNVEAGQPYFNSKRFAISDDIKTAPERFRKIMVDTGYLNS